MSIRVGTAVLVTGDTYSKKDELKSLGGTWCKPLNGWIFEEGKRASIIEKLGAAVADGPTPPPSPLVPSENARAMLLVGRHKKATLVSGETMKVKSQLLALKGKWNPALGGWIFSGGQRASVIDLLRRDPTNQVEVEEEEADKDVKPAAKKTKKVEVADDDSE